MSYYTDYHNGTNEMMRMRNEDTTENDKIKNFGECKDKVKGRKVN